ncbi:hypothetical protein TPADAL_0345a [Treponema pallidum subsp. pallidum DAL-1]|uniref:Uncharacterized protein n=2 Tax=Treponema pallidum TaxID=160 RepID=A0AAU8RVH2_TREPL|nr:hypothetical protein TPESAMD_0345a [Treponema pallidum subsp. pertenue str. SamoaD]AEZ58531.1 hypothetical protein TPECDC2_0345a [Treponema pallidum subsp. pertenue str. CDC2]AEZ59599.1 hypothetical protein TPEGAU_0345a [Treponema pallidum subsp. pertenue str. Gauthier]AEZ60663.1 hypothetical protein TPADAL_0345a [Treponema pallidum subsp. pallidum DAL-1]AJB40360.1 hypothetical protein TENDBA_0345a [Treponema pallidum subsp. endemicum str. Bosnia A]ASV57991.1 hypothetical protein TPEGhana05
MALVYGAGIAEVYDFTGTAHDWSFGGFVQTAVEGGHPLRGTPGRARATVRSIRRLDVRLFLLLACP